MRTLGLAIVLLPAFADVDQGEVTPAQVPVQMTSSGEAAVAYFNARRGVWETVSQENGTGRGGGYPSAICCGGKCFVWGFGDKGGELPVFDVSRRKWEKIAEPPIESRDYYAASIRKSRVAIWGGYGNKAYNDGAIYDFVKKRWEKIPEAPVDACYLIRLAWIDKGLFLWGGYSPQHDQGYNAGAIYDCQKHTWKTVSESVLDGRYGCTTVPIDDRVLVWGGYGSGEFKADGAIYDSKTDTWEKMPEASIEARSYCGWAKIGSNVYFVFGSSPSKACQDVGVYNYKTRQWKLFDKAPIEGRWLPCVAQAGSKLYVWGGHDRQGGRPKDAAVLDTRTGEWTRIEDLPFAPWEYQVFYR